jgi:prophage maintenance system killer protein
VVFGPHRSTHRDRVEPELQELFDRFHRQLAALENDPDDPGYEEAALYSAVRLHADVIRIHPFEDGNGRTARALMNVVLVRLGLLPIPMEVPKQEYVACLNHFYLTGSATELWDLAQELYQSLIDRLEED